MRRLILILVLLLATGRLLPVWASGSHLLEKRLLVLATVVSQDANHPNDGDHDGSDRGDHDGQGGKNGGDHGNNGNGDGGDHDTDTDNDTGHDAVTDQDTVHDGDSYYHRYSFYGQVRWAGKRPVVGNRELVGQDPWLRFLVPGMRLEVKGKVVAGSIRNAHVVVRSPAVWSYYQGPLSLIGGGEGWARVWYQASGSQARPFYQVPLERADAPVQVLACYTPEGWRALPAGIELNVTPPRPGWWLLEGTWRDGRLLGWRIAQRLPGGCGPYLTQR